MPSNLFGPGIEYRTADDIRREQEAARAEDEAAEAAGHEDDDTDADGM